MGPYKLCRSCGKATGTLYLETLATHMSTYMYRRFPFVTPIVLKNNLSRLICMSYLQYENNLAHVGKRKMMFGKFPFVNDVYFNLTSIHSRQYSTGNCDSQDTIFSLSSGHGKCGVAVIRVSGPGAGNILKEIAGFKKSPPQRKAILRRLVDPDTKQGIDRGLVLWFPGPVSFTGEDCVELQVHGGPAVVAALLAALYKLPACRQADAGEFTKRAFMNGKLDLTEVEGLGDLIHAETEAQRRQALRQMEGDLSILYTRWRTTIIKCVANIEAYIDFSEDQDIESDVIESVCDRVAELQTEIRTHLDDNRQGERLREGVHVAIVGEPNVGKSSLLNTICQRPAAIVTPIAGTTRDVIESSVNIGGFPVLLSDTAGLRHTEDEIEQEGVKRALNRAQTADVRILMVDLGKYDNIHATYAHLNTFIMTQLTRLGLLDYANNNNETTCFGDLSNTEDIERQIEHTDKHQNTLIGKLSSQENVVEYLHQPGNNSIANSSPENLMVVFNKSDLLSDDALRTIKGMCSGNKVCACFISCLNGDGIGDFLATLKDKVELMCGKPLTGHPSLTQVRHRSHLIKCLRNLAGFTDMIEADDPVLAAHELRKALRQIGSITGQITSEDILDVIFKDFCIGK